MFIKFRKYLMADDGLGGNGGEVADTTTSSDDTTVDNIDNNVDSNSDTSVNNVEVAAQQEDKHVQSAEENAKFADMRRKTESEARDRLISEMYGESHGIHTYADYQKAVQEQQEAQRLQELINEKGIPEEYAKEMIENKKFREQYEAEKQTIAQRQAQEQDYKSFLEAYPEVKPEEIPAEVWQENANGKSLVDAYAKYENKLLKQQLEAFKKGQQTNEVNQSNAATSTGSVTGNGNPIVKEITAENIATMSEKEISQNWAQVKKVLNMR